MPEQRNFTRRSRVKTPYPDQFSDLWRSYISYGHSASRKSSIKAAGLKAAGLKDTAIKDSGRHQKGSQTQVPFSAR